MFHLALLGPVAAALNGRPFDQFGTLRGQALLCYLAVEAGRAHQREALMNLLWPDMPLSSSQGNLRQVLYLLRKNFQEAGLPDPYLATRQTVQLNPDLPLTCDVQHFLAAAAGTAARREEAAELYRGPFLADFYLPDSDVFESWAADRRAAYGRLALDNLDWLAAHYLNSAQIGAAEAAARRALALDDLHEPAHRRLISALAARGDTRAAIDHYETFRRRLHDELDAAPAAATSDLAEQIRRGDMADLPAASPMPFAPQTAPRENLPAPTKPFIGREQELQQLDRFYADPAVRLVTILGPGGMGKTQLAIEWARTQAARSNGNGRHGVADGVFFVDLAPLDSLDQIAPAIAETFPLPLQGEQRSPEQQLIDYLREKRLLLILDNFEQLTGAAPFVNDILRAAPGVLILVTSRERLQLSMEQVYVLEGLAYPAAAQERGELESFAAVQLFLRSARRAVPTWQLAGEDQEALLRICHTTAGMPLAIELAAAWIDLLPLRSIAAEIERRLDMLETEARDLPQRHRSIRAAIDATWQYLEPAEQEIFARLTVFRGGFSWEAAAAVLGAAGAFNELTLRRALQKLRDKSLLTYDTGTARFTVHELLRQYGAEKLGAPERTHDLAQARESHALYFARLLQTCEAGLKGTGFGESLNVIDADHENILCAWEWLIANEGQEEAQQALAAALDSFGLYHEIRGYLATGRRNFRPLVADLRQRLAEDPAAFMRDVFLLSRALAWQAVFAYSEEEALPLLEESLALLDDPRLQTGTDQAEKAFALYRLGIALSNAQKVRATACFQQSLAIYQDLGDLRGAGSCLFGLGFAHFQVNLVAGRRYLAQASELLEQSGDVRLLGQTLGWLVVAAALQGDEPLLEKAFSRHMALIAGLEHPLFMLDTFYAEEMYWFAKGDYTRADALRHKIISIHEEWGRADPMSKVYLAVNSLHSGQFDSARALLRETRSEFEQAALEDDFRLAFNFHISALLALAEEEFTKALDYLLKALATYEVIGDLQNVAGAEALRIIILASKADVAEARPGLLRALRISLDQGAIIPLVETLLATALLRAHEGDSLRARSLYEQVMRRPRFATSAVYKAIAGRKIRALTADIPADVLDAITSEAAAHDIWQEAQRLLDQLQADGQEDAGQGLAAGE